MQIRRTKIIATLGPATDSNDALGALLNAGADILRINLSHGTHEEQATRAVQVRAVARELGKEVAILADLRGPKIRLEKFADGSVDLKTGDVFTLDASDKPAKGTQDRIGVTCWAIARESTYRVAVFPCQVSPNMTSWIFQEQRPWAPTTWRFPSRVMPMI
jgi:pyruvate kinase